MKKECIVDEELDCENLYIIKFIKEFISVFDYKRGFYIKFEGEQTFKFDDNFWEWFKRKIEYDNEILCFVVVTDKENFEIDNSIKIATRNGFNPDLLQYKNYNILKFPKEKKQSPKKKKENKSIKNNSELVEFMIQKLKG